ncbi:hypothetical protein ACFCZV_09540 [Streptomyces hydrogenans]|uniref:hypothetical protein n=1 Tax=Streptomyces hydrogenans TaxID=1873719 RepID=UPI0035DD9616
MSTDNGEYVLRIRRGSSAALMMALVAFAAGCGGSGSDAAPTKPPAGDSAAKETGAGGAAVDESGSDTVFRTEERFKQALPDPTSMAGWTPRGASAEIEEAPEAAANCGPDADWYCARIARGEADYEAVGEEAQFDLTAFADKGAAQDACRKQKAWSAKYTKAQTPPIPGVDSYAYYRNAGGLDGLNLYMCTGTVVAQVLLEGEGSTLDPDTAHALGQLFAARIHKAAAAS